jgi:hypothetical protein
LYEFIVGMVGFMDENGIRWAIRGEMLCSYCKKTHAKHHAEEKKGLDVKRRVFRVVDKTQGGDVFVQRITFCSYSVVRFTSLPFIADLVPAG